MIVLKSNDKAFRTMSLNSVCLQFISWLDGAIGFGELHREVHFSSHRIRAYKFSTDYLNLVDYLVKVLFAWFFYFNSTFSFSLYIVYSMEVNH